ncbi:histidine kinase [Actinoplanes sp. NPDC049599]|uniref:ATP-binding protein n=1 Tax=Actinoplanes sp. NPDC049599 TaxID=3363903 RepID=UPI0037B1B5B3
MERIPGWLLPLVLAVTQLAVWPGIPLADGRPPAAPAVATGVTATVAVAVALLWRRAAPLTTIGIVAAALTAGTWGVPPDALLIISLADLVALYSVAVRRSHRLTLGAGAAVVLWQCALIAAASGLGPDYPAELVILLVVYASVVAFGRARHRWHAERGAAAARLAEAEDRRARAADTERHHLARELHDVTAHHLTSIVVIASAAQRLGATRPDLVAEARDFAARTGRDTLAALHRLVALLRLPDERPGPAAAGLTELAEGFRLLGQQVTVRAEPGDLPAATTEAICGITREALTNTLRYAPAAAVRIRLTPVAGALELTVDDDGARAEGVATMGSGRGVTGMRERATALGGTLTAGPRPGGGWRVRAVLPAAGTPPEPRRRPRRPGAERVIDVVVFLVALFPPAGALLLGEDDPQVTAASVPLLVLVSAIHAIPLLWRRTHPWTALGAVAATGWIVPALIAAGVVAPAQGWVLLAGLGAEAAAVYGVARYGRRPELSALAIPLALSSAVLATAATLALDPPPEGDLPYLVWVVVLAAMVGCPVGLPMGASWLAGYLVRRRHTTIRTREHDAVAAATAQALLEAGRERARVAAGLREAVLRDTARVATAADAGDLDQVLASARTALDAMRGLLNGLRDDPDPARDPQPTAAALPGLADRWRAGGRRVALEIRGAGRPLPADVDLSVFRVVELLLAGDTGPVTVRVDLTGDPLRIGMRPMPADEGGEIAAGLRARLAAVGGSMTTAADGLPELHLPGSSPAPDPHPDDSRPDERRSDPGAGEAHPSSADDADPPAGASSPTDAAGPAGASSATDAAGPAGAGSATDSADAGGPGGGGGSRVGTISAGDGPGTPAGDDKEVASSPFA